jgi:hypothetical protein
MVERRTLIGLTGLFALPAARALAQATAAAPETAPAETPARDMEPYAWMGEVSAHGRYVPALETARRYQRGSTSNQLEGAAQASGLVGLEGWALRAHEAATGVKAPSEEDRAKARKVLNGASAVPAIEALAARARGRQIVIINEAHHVSRHRAFTRQLGARLRRDGFAWFAAETFQRPIDDLRSGVVFTHQMGNYSNDPIFAETVRSLREVGYRFVAYDYDETGRPFPTDLAQQLTERDGRAARHLVEKVFDKDPHARLLVHVGYSHLSKLPVPLNGHAVPTLATLLHEHTGFDPLCIDQITYTPASTPKLDRAILSEALDRFAPTEPVLVRTADGLPLEAPRKDVDEVVFHPRTPAVLGRSGWRMIVPGSRPVLVDARPAQAASCQILHAFHDDEASAGATPADMVVLQPADTTVALALRPGRYRLRGETTDGFVELGPLKV